jgi:hypothetical protein
MEKKWLASLVPGSMIRAVPVSSYEEQSDLGEKSREMDLLLSFTHPF